MLNEISIEILQRCPNRCIYCSSNSNPLASNIIPYERIVSVIDDAISLGCRQVCLSGGEPFLHPHILQIIEYIAKKQISCYVYSSGIYLLGNVYLSLPNDYIEAIRGLVDKVIFNVEADTSKLYDKIMGTQVGGFELMKKSIRDCVSAGLNVEAHVVPMRCNYGRLESIFEMCYSLGISKVSILRLVIQGRALENTHLVKLDASEKPNVSRLIQTLHAEFKDKVRIGLPFSDSSCRMFCKAATDKINIRYDGNVYPCEVFKDDLLNEKLGCQPNSIYKDSFLDIYNSSIYLNVVRNNISLFKNSDTDESCYGQFKINE